MVNGDATGGPEEELAPGKKSKVEVIKEESKYLRGTVAAELARDSTHFTEEDYQVLKFHGIYQQDDRDLRQQRKKEGKDKQWIFMIRSKVPGGVLTAEQYLAHDDLATRYANGTLRITTRQDFQLHGVLKHSLKTIIRAINQNGVTTLGACGDLERNIMCCPAPLPDRVRSKVQAYARQLSDHLLPRTRAYYEVWLNGEKILSTEEEEEPIYGRAYLPRKFKTGIAFPGDNCIDVYSQDVGIVPVITGEDVQGFNLLIGGGLGMTHGMETTYPRLASPVAFVTPDQFVPAVEAIVTVYRDYGDRTNRKHARLKYVVEERGVPWFKAEMERRLGYPLADPLPITWEGVDDHLGWHPQGDGRWFLGVYVENGRIRDGEGMRMKTAFRSIVQTFRPGVRLTPHQNILFTDVAAADKAAIDALLAEHGVPPVQQVSNARRYAMACPALPTCGLAMSDAERVLPSVVHGVETELTRLGLQDVRLSIRMTGCPNGCARPYLGDIGFVGRTLNAYNIYIGGDFEGTRLNEPYAELVRKDKLVETLVPLFELYKAERQPGEGFGDFCHRLGLRVLRDRVGAVEAKS